jgi:hypothetical protein
LTYNDLHRPVSTCTKETTARKPASRLDFYGKFTAAPGLFAKFLYRPCYSFAVRQIVQTQDEKAWWNALWTDRLNCRLPDVGLIDEGGFDRLICL